LNIGPGDEVIIPDFSFPATANAVIKVGATPVCADIDLETFCINPEEIVRSISPKTKAIMPVHAFGLCANMAQILQIAKDFELRVIEDAACAIGSTIKSKYAGTFGDCGVFSFHPRKLITTGEGGAIVTDDDSLADRIQILRSHGGVRNEFYFDFVEAGYNFRLSDINSAVGSVQLKKLETIIRQRRKHAEAYMDLLGNISTLILPSIPNGFGHTFQSFVILLDQELERNHIIAEMRKLGIETTLGTYSISAQPYFSRYLTDSSHVCPQSLRAFNSSLTLPLYPSMKGSDIKQVAESLRRVLSQNLIRSR
jgi:perosamine synthetase